MNAEISKLKASNALDFEKFNIVYPRPIEYIERSKEPDEEIKQ